VSKFFPEKIYVEEDVRGLPLTGQVLDRCGGIPVEDVPSPRELIRSFHRENPPGSDRGKKILLLCRNRGRFLEPCPGTKKDYRCCGYTIINTGTGCPLDCSYCVLRAYLNNPFITLYVNRQDMMAQLESGCGIGGGKILRAGTGEYMDSLALEHLTDFASFVLPFFRERQGAVLELKTKTADIETLVDLDHGGAFIVSWSLNAEEIAENEELGAVPIPERIAAARRLIEKGYRVGFHFDPVVFYPGWEEGYRDVVDLLSRQIDPAAVAWVSIGSLRYMPRLKGMAVKNFPKTKIYSQELVPGLDGKMRYLQEIRIEMYSRMVSWLREYSKDIFIYYCMENPHVWEKTLGFSPTSNRHLKELLDQRVSGYTK